MGTSWDIHLLSGPSYRPTAKTLVEVFAFLRKSLHAPEPTMLQRLNSMEDDVEVGPERLPSRLRAAALPGAPTTIWTMDNQESDRLFGVPEEAKRPEEIFTSDTLELQITPIAYPYADWEHEKAACPACRKSVVSDLDMREGDMAGPLTCDCGVRTPLDRLKYSGGVQASQLSIAFLFGKGWQNNLWVLRNVFKDRSFLPSLQRILGKRLNVLALSH